MKDNLGFDWRLYDDSLYGGGAGLHSYYKNKEPSRRISQKSLAKSINGVFGINK